MNLNVIPRWLLYGLIVLLVVLFMQGCKCPKCTDCTHPISKSRSLNLSLTGNPSDEEIKKKFNAIRDNLGHSIADQIKIKRCPCDSGLVNVALPEGFLFEGHDGTAHISPAAGGSGGDVDLTDFGAVAINIEVATFDTDGYGNQEERPLDAKEQGLIINQFKEAISAGKSATIEPVKIAILDSGFDPNTFVQEDSWKTNTTLCEAVPGRPVTSDHGWNFLTNSASEWDNTLDSVDRRHGSRVAFLAAKQFTGSPIPVKIIPMKVLNKNNKGDLFSILCALETARKNHVHIINMSLGYYGARDAIFEEYIKRSTDDKIWVIVAAGNQKSSAHERNLSVMDTTFYPAMFSRSNKRVITVTTTTLNPTTGKLVTCDRQNYDPHFVVGVKNDEDCRFSLTQSPAGSNPALIFGSSYASPILAGWLGRSIREVPLTHPHPRQEIVSRMNNSGVSGLYQGRTITRR